MKAALSLLRPNQRQVDKRSGKTSGASNASFSVRGKKHSSNAKTIQEMRKLQFYRKYPAKGVENLGGRKGWFDNLDMHCGMAFDRTEDLSILCPSEPDDKLFVWSRAAIAELNKKSKPLQILQLDMLAYLWELTYDLLLSKDDNVSESPGFESFGLRPITSKRTKA